MMRCCRKILTVAGCFVVLLLTTELTLLPAAAQPDFGRSQGGMAPIGRRSLLRQKLNEAEAAVKNAPASEAAHVTYIRYLLRSGETAKARDVLRKLQALNPRSAQAAVLEKQFAELEAYPGKPSASLLRRQAEELAAAARKDEGRAEPGAAVAMPETLVRQAQETNQRRDDAMRKRFPDLCSRKDAHTEEQYQVQSQLVRAQVNRGPEGRKSELMKLVAEQGSSLPVIIEYVKFLIDEESYGEAATAIVRGQSLYPNDIELQLLAETIRDIQGTSSNEQRAARRRALTAELLSLQSLRLECSLQRLKKKK